MKWSVMGERCQLPIRTFWRSMTAGHSPHPLAQSDRLPWQWAVRWRPRRKKRQGRGHWRPDRVTRCSRPQWSPCPLAPGWFWLDLPQRKKNMVRVGVISDGAAANLTQDMRHFAATRWAVLLVFWNRGALVMQQFLEHKNMLCNTLSHWQSSIIYINEGLMKVLVK